MLSEKFRTKSILLKGFTVETKNSTYVFGEAIDDDGGRFVDRVKSSKDSNPLGFQRCRILKLELGEEMKLECLDATHPFWYTTKVLSIKPSE